MAETPTTGRTIHIHRNQWHLAWDHSIPPIATIPSGETISFDLLDASCGQIVAESTVDAIRTLDFSQVDQVNGPIYVEGATVRLTVHKDVHVAEPQFLTAGPLAQRTNTAPFYATDGIWPDLMEAARNAVRHMIDYLQRSHGLSRADAYMLCSVAVDLKLCEVVDAPHWVVSAFLPQSIFTTLAQ